MIPVVVAVALGTLLVVVASLPAGAASVPPSTSMPSTGPGRSLVDARDAVLADARNADSSEPTPALATGSTAPGGVSAQAQSTDATGCGANTEAVAPTPPRPGVVLTPVTSTVIYDCVTDQVTFRVETASPFDPRSFGAWTVLLDTDLSGMFDPIDENCHGGEQIGAVYQDSNGTFAATLLTMGSDCDTEVARSPATFVVTATSVAVTVAAADLRVRQAGADVGRVAELNWAAELSSMTEVTSGQPGSPVPADGYAHLDIPNVGAYTPVTPTRVLDTRDGTGGPVQSLGASGRRDFAATGPLTPPPGLTTVVLHVTAVDPSSPTYLALWPAGEARPLASNLNAMPGSLDNGLVMVKVGAAGLVSLYNHLGSVDVVVDVYGWFTATSDDGGSLFTGVDPRRLLDTRDGTGIGRRTPLAGGEPITVPVVGALGGLVPAGATAVVVNLTAVAPTEPTFVRAWAAGPAPWVAALNVDAGRTLPNMAVIPLGPDGSMRLDNAFGRVHLVVDVLGFFRPSTLGGGPPPVPAAVGRFVSMTPTRILDTRDGTGGISSPLGVAPVEFDIAGRVGVPTHAQAVVLSVVAVDPTSDGYVTLYPAGTPRPLASNLNVVSGRTVANLVTVKLGADGAISLFNFTGRTHVVADLAGWIG